MRVNWGKIHFKATPKTDKIEVWGKYKRMTRMILKMAEFKDTQSKMLSVFFYSIGCFWPRFPPPAPLSYLPCIQYKGTRLRREESAGEQS